MNIFKLRIEKMLYPPSHQYLVPSKFIFWIRFFPDPPPLFEQMSENLQFFFWTASLRRKLLLSIAIGWFYWKGKVKGIFTHTRTFHLLFRGSSMLSVQFYVLTCIVYKLSCILRISEAKNTLRCCRVKGSIPGGILVAK